MKKQAFTLIELLVVIVIIGILATISTATFSGHFAKARDSERQTFIQSASRIIIASQLGEEAKDYRFGFGFSDSSDITGFIKSEFEENGLDIPDKKNEIPYHYIIVDGVVDGPPSLEFIFFACKEETLGDSASEASDIAFVAGDYENLSSLVDEFDAMDLCGIPPEGGSYPLLNSVNHIISN